MTGDRDLFGEVRGPAPRRVGRRIHLPHSVRAEAERMSREGATGAKIAEAIGISERTLWSRLGVELKRAGGRGPGRPTWVPTADDRATVLRLTIAFETVETIASRLGCTAPTLRLHCREELTEGRRLRRTADR